MYVCICRSVTEQQVLDAINSGAADIRDLQAKLGVGTQCGACSGCLQKILDNCGNSSKRSEATDPMRPASSRF